MNVGIFYDRVKWLTEHRNADAATALLAYAEMEKAKAFYRLADEISIAARLLAARTDTATE